ncbi:hypothetical protein D3C72_1422090 [compost metagenome]
MNRVSRRYLHLSIYMILPQHSRDTIPNVRMLAIGIYRIFAPQEQHIFGINFLGYIPIGSQIEHPSFGGIHTRSDHNQSIIVIHLTI